MDLEEILSSKPLYYTKFDPNRIIEAYESIKNSIKHPKRVQLIGTNGKGSTGRAIAHLAYKSGLNVGHFTSPHILDFKERFWINGKFATKNFLQNASDRLTNLLGSRFVDSLSYFEYQALLAFVGFENLDLQVIEAGLGGEFDATSVVDYDLNVITPIGLDHADFLGNTLNDVATTKLNAIKKTALISMQESKEIYKIAKEGAKQKKVKLFFYEDFRDSRFSKIEDIKEEYPNYLIENLTNATYALDILDIKYDLEDLITLKLFGRFYKLKPNITLDVGHNLLAAKAISKSLTKKVDLIFNILNDKEAKEILLELKPKIETLYIIKLDIKRATDLEKIESILRELNIEYDYFDGNIKEYKNYLVFGSFYVVEEFLKSLNIEKIL